MADINLGHATAYGYAKSKGYSGTEEEFAQLMANYGTVGQTATQAAQTATTKASEAASSASNATLSATNAANSAQEAADIVENIIDDTLTQEGKAADAKVTGDRIGELRDDLSVLDSVLIAKGNGNTGTIFDYPITANNPVKIKNISGLSLTGNIRTLDNNDETVETIANTTITTDETITFYPSLAAEKIRFYITTAFSFTVTSGRLTDLETDVESLYSDTIIEEIRDRAKTGIFQTTARNDIIYLKQGETIDITVTSKDSGSLSFFVKPYVAGDSITTFEGIGTQTYTAPRAGMLGTNTGFSGLYQANIVFANRVPFVVNLSADINTPLVINDVDNVIINGNGHKINLGTQIPYTSSGNIRTAPYIYKSGDLVEQVFVNKTKPLINTSSGVERTYFPNVALWMVNGSEYNSAIELDPKETISEVNSTENSYTYDPDYNRFIVNCATAGTLYLASELVNGLSFSNVKNAQVNNLTIMFAHGDNVYSENSMVKYTSCKALFSTSSNGFKSITDKTVIYDYCESIQNRRDGFSGNGTTCYKIYNSLGAYNHDDGISNHGDLAYGLEEHFIIENSRFIGNSKAGIASPVYGSSGIVTGNICADNLMFGIEIATNTSYPVVEPQYIKGNLLLNNDTGLYNESYDNVYEYQNVFSGNTTDKVGTFISL